MEGNYILDVVDFAAVWAAEKIAIASLPYHVSGSNVGAQKLFGCEDRNRAVLYSLRCPAKVAATIVVVMVRDVAAAGFGVRR